MITGVVLGVWNVARSALGIRTEEEPRYEILARDGEKELRAYAPVIVVRTAMRSAPDANDNEAFYRLFGYISGKNAGSTEIAMTAPVLQERDAEGGTMSFVLPASYTQESAPRPLDPAVEVGRIEAQTVATLRYSGYPSRSRTERRADELLVWVRSKGYEPLTAVRAAFYDPPFTIPFLRRNEVQVPLAPR